MIVFAALWLYELGAPRPEPWLAAAGLEPRFEMVHGHRLRFVRAGRGPAVVLVHGFGSSLYTWKAVMPELSRAHDVLALDLPGFGESEQPADLSLDELPAAVTGLMERLGIARAALVGSSMGGAAAALVCARAPERAGALVLIDAAGFDIAGPGRPRLVRMATSPLGGLLAWLPVKRLLVEAALREVFCDDTLVTDERVAEYLALARRPGSYAAVRSLSESLEGRSGVVQEALADVRVPTLVVWGGEDTWIPVAHAARFGEAIAGSRQVVIENTGHLPQEERPGELLRVLRPFLRDVTRGEAAARGPSAPADSADTGA